MNLPVSQQLKEEKKIYVDRSALRIWLREVLLSWHDFVASLLPPVQLLSWLRRGEQVLTCEELEERMKQQAFRPAFQTTSKGE